MQNSSCQFIDPMVSVHPELTAHSAGFTEPWVLGECVGLGASVGTGVPALRCSDL